MGLFHDIFKSLLHGQNAINRDMSLHFSHGCSIYDGYVPQDQLDQLMSTPGEGKIAECGWAMLFGHTIIVGAPEDIEKYIDEKLKDIEIAA